MFHKICGTNKLELINKYLCQLFKNIFLFLKKSFHKRMQFKLILSGYCPVVVHNLDQTRALFTLCVYVV